VTETRNVIPWFGIENLNYKKVLSVLFDCNIPGQRLIQRDFNPIYTKNR